MEAVPSSSGTHLTLDTHARMQPSRWRLSARTRWRLLFRVHGSQAARARTASAASASPVGAAEQQYRTIVSSSSIALASTCPLARPSETQRRRGTLKPRRRCPRLPLALLSVSNLPPASHTLPLRLLFEHVRRPRLRVRCQHDDYGLQHQCEHNLPAPRHNS